MKKALLGATAIAGSLLVAGVANAQTAPTISWGGFQYTYWSFVDETFGPGASPLTYKKDLMTTDTEVKISIRGETADKTKYGAITEFEADRGSSANIDENFLYFENAAWGRIEFGDRGGAKGKMHFGTPTNAGYDGGIDGTRFLADEPSTVHFHGMGGWDSGKVTKLTYYTPRMADGVVGFAVSYAPTNNRGGNLGGMVAENINTAAVQQFGGGGGNGGTSAGASITNLIEFGSNAIFKVGDGSMRIAGGIMAADYPTYLVGTAQVTDFFSYTLGVNYQLGMLQVGAQYNNHGESGHLSTDTFKGDTVATSVGISYGSWGAYRVAFQWLNVSSSGSGIIEGNDESTVYAVSGDYQIFPGLMLWGEVIASEHQDESNLATFSYYNKVLTFTIGAALNY